ncbi:Subtilisin inhibitor 1 [Ananas comosus]|uniref:Subtilisin inhibitor 1 n=1 Tax=Ananas comosus TaxID=4615 RepID=A0A199W8U1_ANACO|nr:Subtilisin inhibitor 1 [Ananas comosus]
MNSVRGMNNPNNKTMSEMVTEILVPAYNIITEATYNIASKIQDAGPRYEAGAKQMWDKGIAVKEYLVHKLEPGEDDRALCEVITEAVSPRSDGCNQAEEKGSFVEKMRVAASSLHGQEESQGSPIPVSTNPYTEGEKEVQASAPRHSWPEVVGLTTEEAEKRIRQDKPDARFQVVPPDHFVTMDYDTGRVRIFIDSSGKVAKTPLVG